MIFSHSSARALDDHTRNVSDAVLTLVKSNGGVVMVNFARIYISDEYRRWSSDQAAEVTRLNAFFTSSLTVCVLPSATRSLSCAFA